ncbi:MAG: EscU/YscU/HrcU family type III secretion system export apparatus switch protein [Spirochaetales bacterium]|nr:EscU/YscU/HrcU family type III secretion system export apparatus switch protein [Spirochaetales bacterium]
MNRSLIDIEWFLRGGLRPLDLQLFAAEDEGRTELPTERRRREERDKGNVPRSQDLAGSVVLLGTVILLFFLSGLIFYQSRSLFERFLTLDTSAFYSADLPLARFVLTSMFWETAKIVGPLLGVGFLLAILGNVTQVGLLFSARTLEFKLERLIPDFKRVLPTRRTMYNLARVMVQFLLIGFAAYLIIIDDFIPMLSTSDTDLAAALTLFGWASFKLLLVSAVILFVLSVPDFFYQRFEFMENLKMTISEVKRERREEEGDPLIRQRQRERGYELRKQRDMLEAVPSADVVITNPTHYAVALGWDREQRSQAPVVVAKGKDHIAFLIRTIALKNEVPIQENPPLARTLYNEVELGREIPETLYRAVSAIFARLEKYATGVRN